MVRATWKTAAVTTSAARQAVIRVLVRNVIRRPLVQMLHSRQRALCLMARGKRALSCEPLQGSYCATSNGFIVLSTTWSASRKAAAFHDWPGIPRAANVRPCNHSVKSQLLIAQERASFTRSARAAFSWPHFASAATQKPPTIGQMPPLWYCHTKFCLWRDIYGRHSV